MTKRVRVSDNDQDILDKLNKKYDQIKSHFFEGPYVSKNMCLETLFHINITTPPKFDWCFKCGEAYAVVVIWVRSCEIKQVITVNDKNVIATEMMLPRSDIFTLTFRAVNTSSGIRVSLIKILSNNSDIKKLVVQALGMPWMLSDDYNSETVTDNSVFI